MITFHYVEQGSEQWHIDREDKYTGSNADKLLGGIGVHDYAKAKKSEFKGTFWTKRGHALEDQAVQLYERIHAVSVDRPGYITNSKYSDCLYSPDAVDQIPIIEVKSFDIPQHLKLIESHKEHDLPLKIRAQIHWGLFISERAYAILIPFNPVFSKKEIDGIPNKLYDPKKAYKEIIIKRNKDINANFKRILRNAASRQEKIAV